MNSMEAVSFPKGKLKARQMHKQILPNFPEFQTTAHAASQHTKKRAAAQTHLSLALPKQGKDTTTRETTWNQFPRAISKQKFLTKFLQTKHYLIGFISRYKFGSAYRIRYVQYGCKHTFS